MTTLAELLGSLATAFPPVVRYHSQDARSDMNQIIFHLTQFFHLLFGVVTFDSVSCLSGEWWGSGDISL